MTSLQPPRIESVPAPQQMRGKPRVLFICGSLNQTRQMHQIAEHLDDCDASYTPYYADGLLEWARRLGWLEFTIVGWKRRKQCLRYLRSRNLRMDFEGNGGTYDLVVTCSDVIVPDNVRDVPVLGVQEGITDPIGFWYWARRVLPVIPRWTAGTAWTGTSNLCTRFCVASEGYRNLFIERGADPSKLVVTGIPNFDNCSTYRINEFPHQNYVLVCTSDARETFKLDSRKRFLKRALELARGRPVIFKLHPNEDHARAKREIGRVAPDAIVFTNEFAAEHMVANCAVLICQYSTLAFIGLALGKEVHSHFSLQALGQLLPIQNGTAALQIAQECRSLLAESAQLHSAGSSLLPQPRECPAS